MKMIFSPDDLIVFAGWFLYGKVQHPGQHPIKWKQAQSVEIGEEEILVTDTNGCTWSFPTQFFLDRFETDYLISREIYPETIAVVGTTVIVDVPHLPKPPSRLPGSFYETYKLTPAKPKQEMKA